MATFGSRALGLTREVVYWPVLALKSISIWGCINCASILLVDLLHVLTIRYIQQFTFYKDNVLFMTYVRFLHGDSHLCHKIWKSEWSLHQSRTSQLCFSIINANYPYNNLKKHKMTLKKHMYTMAFEGISVTQRNCNIVVTWSFSERQHFSTLTDCGGTNVKHPISEKKHHTSTTLKPPVKFGLYLILGKTSSVWVIAG